MTVFRRIQKPRLGDSGLFRYLESASRQIESAIRQMKKEMSIENNKWWKDWFECENRTPTFEIEIELVNVFLLNSIDTSCR